MSQEKWILQLGCMRPGDRMSRDFDMPAQFDSQDTAIAAFRSTCKIWRRLGYVPYCCTLKSPDGTTTDLD